MIYVVSIFVNCVVSIFVFYDLCCFYFVFCDLCYFSLRISLFLPFVYKCKNHCHRLETQLQ